MRGLLRKDLELARLNIKIWGVLFFIGVIYHIYSVAKAWMVAAFLLHI